MRDFWHQRCVGTLRLQAQLGPGHGAEHRAAVLDAVLRVAQPWHDFSPWHGLTGAWFGGQHGPTGNPNEVRVLAGRGGRQRVWQCLVTSPSCP